nr:unnamed protein product [Digitaria exilis]
MASSGCSSKSLTRCDAGMGGTPTSSRGVSPSSFNPVSLPASIAGIWIRAARTDAPEETNRGADVDGLDVELVDDERVKAGAGDDGAEEALEWLVVAAQEFDDEEERDTGFREHEHSSCGLS